MAGLLVAQAFLLAGAIVAVFTEDATFTEIRGDLGWLAAVVVARAVLGYVSDVVAQRSGARATSELRAALLNKLTRLGPAWLAAPGRTGEMTTLATRGVDSLQAYFSRYLPQLVLAAIVPVVVAAAIVSEDLLAAITVCLTVPLIPVFMVLVGRYTESRTARQWRVLGVLTNHFLDVLQGLPTLKAFNRSKYQSQQIRSIGQAYRDSTIGVLRVAFLSSLVLELISSLAVALVAVGIGLRLVNGSMDLLNGLIVLILVGEVYLPLRMVGVQFHAAADGVSAAGRIFEVLETPDPTAGTDTDVPDLRTATIEVHDVSVTYPDRGEPALDPASLVISPGTSTALVGPSGCGKSTLLMVLLALLAPTSGQILIRSADGRVVDLATLDPLLWRQQVGWVPAEPHLVSATLRDNVRLGAPDADDEQVVAALDAVGLTAEVRHLPQGLDTPMGEGGRGLSTGQLRRLAIARVLLRPTPMVVLDEPTASLDDVSERIVVRALEDLARERTLVYASHRGAPVAVADQVVTVHGAGAREVPV